MKTPLCFLAAAAALMATAAHATSPTTWDDAYAAPNSPYMAPVADETGLGYDATGPGVDPIYSTPSVYEETGMRSRNFIPNEAYMEYLGNMSFNGGGGRVQVLNTVVTLPLLPPQQASWKKWHLDVKGTARLTWLDCKGRNLIDEDKLYTIGVHATLARNISDHSQLLLGLTPQFSTDFDVMSHHNFFLGGYVAYSAKANEQLRYTLGLACMPDYYRSVLLPVFSLQWRYNPSWELRMEGTRLSSVYVGHERFHWGPFFQWNTGIWTVHRHRQTQQLRMTNCILGLGSTYEKKTPQGTTLHFLGDLGFSFNNVFRIRSANGDHTLDKFRAHPGFYARLGFRLSF